jgi:hypothetical protein
LVAIEAEYLYNLQQKIYRINDDRSDNTWLAFVANPNSKAEAPWFFNLPVSVKANDALHLSVKLKTVIKSNPTLKTAFPFSGGTLDSIQHHAVGYFTFPSQPIKNLPDRPGGKAQEKKHTINYTLSSWGRDSTFTTQFKYFRKKDK